MILVRGVHETPQGTSWSPRAQECYLLRLSEVELAKVPDDCPMEWSVEAQAWVIPPDPALLADLQARFARPLSPRLEAPDGA